MAVKVLDNLLEEINLNLQNSLSYGSDIQFWEQAYLQEKDGKTSPLVNQGSENGHRISLDDRYPLQIYHRLIDSETIEDPTLGKGAFPYRKRVYSMRLVGIGNTKRLTSRSYEGNDDVKNEVYFAMPKNLVNKERVQAGNENTNKLDVLSEEFDGVSFPKLSLELIAFYIEYQISHGVQCTTTATNVPPVLCSDVDLITANAIIIT